MLKEPPKHLPHRRSSPTTEKLMEATKEQVRVSRKDSIPGSDNENKNKQQPKG